MKDILFLILARSGSKGVKNKNIQLLGDIPLLAYRVLSATKSKLSHDLILSTDSEEFQAIGRKYGARTPFLRSSELSSDSAKSVDACLSAINWLEENEKSSWKYLCLLEPTGPFTKIEWIEEAVSQLEKSDSSGIVACRVTSPNTVFIQDETPDHKLEKIHREIKNLENLNRQEFKRQITPSGNFYISRIDNFKKTKSFYNVDTLSFIVPEPYCLEIDTPMDLKWAQFLIESKTITRSDLGF